LRPSVREGRIEHRRAAAAPDRLGRERLGLTREGTVAKETDKPPDYDKRIRSGLELLYDIDRAILWAAVPLDEIEGLEHPPTALKALRRHTFQVTTEGGKTKSYRGRMTKKQWAYLKKHTGSLEKFGFAIAKTIANVHSQVGVALSTLNKALGAPPAKIKAARVDGSGDIPVPVICCCYVDGLGLSNIPQACCVALQGDWDNKACRLTPLL
jgi:hypothetical protein